jgi:hypothetical protein
MGGFHNDLSIMFDQFCRLVRPAQVSVRRLPTKNGQFSYGFVRAKFPRRWAPCYVLGNNRPCRQAFRMSDETIARIKQLLATNELAELGPGPRVGVLSEAALDGQFEAWLPGTKLSRTRQQLIRSLVLLWHDHLDASHTISQGIENADGSFVHAMMHRREPDAWNSKYWWRRVGNHSAFPEIGRRVSELLSGENSDLAKRLVPGGHWDASAFVDACDAARDKALIATLREIQRIETEVLLEYFCHE